MTSSRISLGSLPLTVQPTESQVPRISFTVPASSFGHGSVPHNLDDLEDVIKGDDAAILEEVEVREEGAVIGGVGKEGRGMGEIPSTLGYALIFYFIGS
ncbi:hypothetical protein ACFX2I_047213 [Malus domestica]